jgi:hypothetical protein
MKRLLVGLVIAAVVGAIGVAIAWEIAVRIALEPHCDSDVLSEQKSPNGTFVFWMFRRNCGATTAYGYGLSIRRAGDEFDLEARDEVFMMEGDVPATASWADVDRIHVDIPKGAEVFRRHEKWEGVTISYATD